MKFYLVIKRTETVVPLTTKKKIISWCQKNKTMLNPIEEGWSLAKHIVKKSAL